MFEEKLISYILEKNETLSFFDKLRIRLYLMSNTGKEHKENILLVQEFIDELVEEDREKCEFDMELIRNYAKDQVTDPKQIALIKQHISTCRACSRFQAETRLYFRNASNQKQLKQNSFWKKISAFYSKSQKQSLPKTLSVNNSYTQVKLLEKVIKLISSLNQAINLDGIILQPILNQSKGKTNESLPIGIKFEVKINTSPKILANVEIISIPQKRKITFSFECFVNKTEKFSLSGMEVILTLNESDSIFIQKPYEYIINDTHKQFSCSLSGIPEFNNPGVQKNHGYILKDIIFQNLIFLKLDIFE